MTPNESKVILTKLEGIERLFEEKFRTNENSHNTIRDLLHKKANKWTEAVIKFGMGALGIWVINQILNLIPKAHALINNI